jgi:D-alanine-D-alanine ligase
MARVLLLFGGRSAEHEVSCVSAVAVLEALEDAGHQVIPVGIGRDGAWYLADRTRRPLQAAGRSVVLRLPEGTLAASGDVIAFDVAFPVLHGPYGEDGTIQGVFETADIPYVGCGVAASAMAMDKDVAKRIFRQAGIPTSAWRVVRLEEFGDPGAVVAEIRADLGVPVFVKPARLGSSVGITKAATDAEAKDGIRRAFAFDHKVVVEEAIRGREIEVAVLEGPRTALPGEVVIETEWYDYDSKYHDETSRFVAPAELTGPEQDRVRTLAEAAFTALGCRGLARVDFFYEERGRGFLLNEVNTMPGFTPISGFPTMWQASGMTYDQLCHELVRIALGD